MGSHDDLTVRIGSENQVEGLAGSAVVTTGYGPHSLSVAHIGVLGPTRMDYPGTMGSGARSGALPGPDSEPVRKTMAADYANPRVPRRHARGDQACVPEVGTGVAPG